MKSEWNILGLSKAVLETIDSLDFQKMTPVQVIDKQNENLKKKMNVHFTKAFYCFSLQQFHFFWIEKMLR